MTKQTKQPSQKAYEATAAARMKIPADKLGAKTKPVPMTKPLKKGKP